MTDTNDEKCAHCDNMVAAERKGAVSCSHGSLCEECSRGAVYAALFGPRMTSPQA